MNDIDAARIIGLFAAAWPWAEWPEPTVALWQNQLADLDADIAAIAARRCVTELERPPAIATFLERYNGQRRATEPVYRALAAVNEPWDGSKAHVQRIQTMLANAKSTDRHWHGGKQPCPVCGGS